jgi:hypothetical protein
MGVHGATCQLCRLPLQHDHYVPQRGGAGMLKIYRGGSEGGGHEWEEGEPVVRFGPEHAWLADAIGVPFGEGALLRGAVEDGSLTDAATGADAFIWDGDEDALAFHAYCWKRMGEPVRAGDAVVSRGLHLAAFADTYAGQLYEFRELIDHGKGWMLADPRGTTGDARRSAARIDAILADARRTPPPQTAPKSVADVLAADRGWRGIFLRENDHAPRDAVRYRANLDATLDLDGYTTLVWAMKEHAGGGLPSPEAWAELEAFEVAVKAAVEQDAAAILIMVTIDRTQAQYLIYARDEAATRAAIDAAAARFGSVTRPIDYDNETDPGWKVYFANMDPRRFLG